MRYLKRTLIVLFLPLLLMGWGAKEVGITEGIAPGNLAPVTDLQGIEFDENEFVLVQFWASSNPQSRIENVLMHNAISGMDNSNIKLVSISLDESEAIFNGAIIADRLDKRTQYFLPGIKESAAFRKYKLNDGSGNWLINPEGMIVAANLSQEEIKQIYNERR